MLTIRKAVAALGSVAVAGGLTAAGLTAPWQAGAAAAPAAHVSRTGHVVEIRATDDRYALATNGRIPAGLVELKLANQGRTDHQALLFRLHPGVTLAEFVRALKSGGLGALRLVDPAGGVNTVPARAAEVTWQALQGGRYVLIDLNTGPDGVPYVAKGMAAGFTVTGHLPPTQLNAIRPPGRVAGTVTAHTMTFTVPKVVDGRAIYRFTDTDRHDWHEFAIIRLKPHVTAADVIAYVRNGRGAPPFTSAGGFGAETPGNGGWLRLDLAPGRYAAICFVPDDQPPHMPHAAMGMVVAFTVVS
jgi:hypothetical protein